MLGALSDVLKSLMGSREGVVPGIEGFPALDVKQMARDLRLEARGEEDGKQGEPAADSESETVVERDLVAEIARHHAKAAEDYRSQLELYDSRIRRARAATGHSAAVEAAGEGALTDFRVQASDERDQLENARRELEGRERDFASFRAAHRLQRIPRDVSPREKIARWLCLAIIVALESILNGQFFAKGSEAGLIGGVSQAIVLSLLNVGAAAAYARFGIGLLVHRSFFAKFTGLFAAIAFAAWIIGLNFLIGVYRDVFVEQVGQVAVADVLTRLSSGLLVIEDARSWILVGLGFGLGLGALVDLAGMHDVYPGYAAIGRARMEAAAAYAQAKARSFSGLAELRDSAVHQMLQVIELIRSAEYEVQIAELGLARLQADYCGFLSHLQDAYGGLRQLYVEANRRARSVPLPARLLAPPPLLPFLTPPIATPPPAEVFSSPAVVIARMEEFIRAINRQFEAEVSRFPTVVASGREEAARVDARPSPGSE